MKGRSNWDRVEFCDAKSLLCIYVDREPRLGWLKYTWMNNDNFIIDIIKMIIRLLLYFTINHEISTTMKKDECEWYILSWGFKQEKYPIKYSKKKM